MFIQGSSLSSSKNLIMENHLPLPKKPLQLYFTFNPCSHSLGMKTDFRKIHSRKPFLSTVYTKQRNNPKGKEGKRCWTLLGQPKCTASFGVATRWERQQNSLMKEPVRNKPFTLIPPRSSSIRSQESACGRIRITVLSPPLLCSPSFSRRQCHIYE